MLESIVAGATALSAVAGLTVAIVMVMQYRRKH